MIPAMFMTAVTVTYILYAPEGLTALTTATFGTQISYEAATGAGITAAALLGVLFMRYRRSLENAGLAGRARGRFPGE